MSDLEALCFSTGPASAQLQFPTLTSLSWNGVELIQSIAMVVRDRNWGTIPGLIADVESEISGGGSRVTFVGTHDNGDVGFTWDGELSVISSSPRRCVVSYSMSGRATRDFRANRIGFCVLHPLSVAGNPVSLKSSEGIFAGTFPRAVSPDQPFLEFTAMSYAVGNASVEIRFKGGIFETEDQRNWTDASFKTYSPPLRMPFPRTYKKGEEVRQEVVVEVTGPSTGAQRSRSRERVVQAHLGGILPAKLPAVGVGSGGLKGAEEGSETYDALHQLKPSHLHAVVEPQKPGWEGHFRAAAGLASQAGTRLQCEVVVPGPDELEVVAEALTEDKQLLSGLMLFDTTSSVATRTLVGAWGRLAEKYDLPTSVFGGSRANFAELNRNQPPYDLISGLTFAINPQVHAFGDEDIVETLPVQEIVARQAAAMAPSLPLHVGPVTLKPRFNAVATDQAELEEPQPDSRQSSWWAAGWTLGSVAALARGGARSVTYFDLAGPHALLGRTSQVSQSDAAPYPVFQVIRRLAAFRDAHLLATHVSDERTVAMLGLAKNNHSAVFAANLVDEERVIRFEGQAFDFVSESLLAAGGGLAQDRVSSSVDRRHGGREVHLAPYEVVVLTGPASTD